jgi:S1-C subfamily serine protease
LRDLFRLLAVVVVLCVAPIARAQDAPPPPLPPPPQQPQPQPHAQPPHAPQPQQPQPLVHAAPPPRCDAGYIERVYRETKPSVARITRPDGALGTGFVFFSPKHVATALHVVDLGREVRVEFPGGRVIEAEVVAVDEKHDLAILELAESSGARPLAPRYDIDVGAPIVAIGNPYGDLARYSKELEGLLNFSVSQGIVSAKSEAYIQTDAVLSPGNSGGPMLSCDGQVVGVADRLLESRIGFGVPVSHLSTLAQKIGDQKYLGRWMGRDGGFGLVWHSDVNSYFGFYLGGSIVGYDRVAITTRLGAVFGGNYETSEPIVDRSMRRFYFEMLLGYRILFFPYVAPTYMTFSIGGIAMIDRGEEIRLRADPMAPQGLSATTTKIRGGGIQPMAQAVLHLANLELSYGFALDPNHTELSTHRILVGLSF